MKSYSAPIEAQLAAGRLYRRLAVRLDLPSGSYGFVTGLRGSITVGDVLYVGSGGLIDIGMPEAKLSAEAVEASVSLASHRRINGELVQLFEPHVLASIEAEAWFMQPAVVQRFWFSRGRVLQEVEQLYQLAIFDIEHTISANGGAQVKGTLKAPSAFAKVFEAKPNGPDLQRQIDPADTSYDDILTALSDPIYWGRAAPKAGNSKK